MAHDNDIHLASGIAYISEEEAEKRMDNGENLYLCHECNRYFKADIQAGDILYFNLDSDIAYCRECASGNSFEMKPGYSLIYSKDIYTAETRPLTGTGKLIILHERED